MDKSNEHNKCMLEFMVKRFDKAAFQHLRESHKLSQEGLSRELDISGHTIYRWEAGKAKPSQMAVSAIIQKYGQEILNDNFYVYYMRE